MLSVIKNLFSRERERKGKKKESFNLNNTHNNKLEKKGFCFSFRKKNLNLIYFV
jgi:hypothetical protein